jgi:hypothetical protein
MFRPKDPHGKIDRQGRKPSKMWPLPEHRDVFYESDFNVPWDIINVGRSPAFLTELAAEMKLLPSNTAPPRLPSGSKFPNYILSPKSSPEDRHGSVFELPLTDQIFEDLRTGQSRVWIYGIAKYKDALGKKHSTRFCCLWYVENGKAVYDPVGPKGWTKYT